MSPSDLFESLRIVRRVWVVVLLVGLTAGCGTETTDWAPLEPRVPAPDFVLPALDGGPVRLSDLRGNLVVIEFWATWCGPCRYSTPSLEVIFRRFRDRGVSVLLVNQGESAEQITRWSERRFTAPILLDQEFRVAKHYGLQGIPRLFVIDREGRIVYDKSGYGGGLEQNLRVILTQLLAEGT